MKRSIFLTWAICLVANLSFSQTPGRIIRDLYLKIDTGKFSLSQNTLIQNGESRLFFSFQKEDEVCELNIYPSEKEKIKSFKLLGAADYVTLDSMVLVNDEYYRLRLRFVNLFKSQFLNFTFSAIMDSSDKPVVEEVKLLPFTRTSASFGPINDDLFVGEEKVFELISNNVKNIRITNEWTKGLDINYRVVEENGKLMVHLIPVATDGKEVRIKLQTYVPVVTNDKQVVYDLPPVVQSFKVKTSRLVFMSLDKQEITYDEITRLNGIELQLDNGRLMTIGKTYRIENQEQPGGALIAELFTKSSLTNDKMLCIFRPFNFHRKTEGYLYIKDGDVSRFVTNCDITPKTSITSIVVMHEGQDWSPNPNIYPGETVNVKIEGEGMHKAKFHWEDVLDITSDTIIRSENTCFFKLKIPVNITKRRINLYNGVTNTGIALNVKEYQVPHKLDYISLNFGTGNRVLSAMSPTTIQRSTIKDITLNFENNKIDMDDKLYGKQYLDLEVQLLGKKGELIEMKTIKNLLICPGDNSPRSIYYKDKLCVSSSINLNSVLGNKTYNLEDFSRVRMNFKNQEDKYSEASYEKQVEIYVQHPTIFDIDVSFPTGLLIQNLGKAKSDTETDKAVFTDDLGGISLALIAQFSFPDAEKVGAAKPYRVGAGFLGINTFDFGSDADRDFAAVVLASLYPIKPGKVFNLPIHFGFGYKFQDAVPFIMLCPGIGIKF
jgi:hypothetical protein